MGIEERKFTRVPEAVYQEIFIHTLLQLDETLRDMNSALERIAQTMESEEIKK